MCLKLNSINRDSRGGPVREAVAGVALELLEHQGRGVVLLHVHILVAAVVVQQPDVAYVQLVPALSLGLRYHMR